MMPALLVFIGGGLGAVARYGLTLTATRMFGANFPWGTFGINISGSLVMGLIAGFLVARAALPVWDHARLFLTTGLLGGYTTFSAFSLDTILLWERGEIGFLLFYVIGSVVFSVLALFIGYVLAKGFA